MLKKNTDVYEIVDVQSSEKFLIKISTTTGKKLTAALEAVLGSPALDDYGIGNNVIDNQVTIKRYRLQKDIKVSKEQP